MANGNKYDAFLSHNSANKGFVEAVHTHLDSAGLNCFFDKNTILTADNWIRRLEEGLKQSAYFVLFIGAEGMGNWHQAELDVALQRQIQERKKFIIPVLLPGVTAPQLESISVFLSSIHALPFQNEHDEPALNLLIGLISGEKPAALYHRLQQESATPHPLLRSLKAWSDGLKLDWKKGVCEVEQGRGEKCLSIPFKKNQARGDNITSLLEWRFELTEFIGRERELEQLQAWADSDIPIDIQPITGEGGVGKTRLAFEFASRLRSQGWQAGQTGEKFNGAWFVGRAGILLVIDYPEHRSERVNQLLEALKNLEDPEIKIRILLLTRHQDYAQKLTERARSLVRPPLLLQGFDEQARQWQLLNQAWKTVHDLDTDEQTQSIPITEQDFYNWIQQDSFHRNPLIVMALAIYLQKEQPSGAALIGLAGAEVVREITLREIDRIDREVKAAAIAREPVILLKAIAAIAGGLTNQQTKALIKKLQAQNLEHCPPDFAQLKSLSLVSNRQISPLSPDIFAADFLIYALDQYAEGDSAQWQLAVLAELGNRLQNWSRLGRLVFDAQYKLGHRWPVQALAEAVTLDENLCTWVANELAYEPLFEIRLNPVRIAALEVVIENPENSQSQLASYYLTLSNRLEEIGGHRKALTAIQRTVDIFEQLAQDNSASYGPNFAASLNNLSVHLGNSGDHAGALKAVQRAVEIYEKLALDNFTAYGPGLASGLNNLSLRLVTTNNLEGALQSIQRAVDIRESLARDNFSTHGPYLARSLNNLSLRLAETGDHAGGLPAIQRAVDIYEQLARDNFAAYGPNLAMSLSNLSLGLTKTGDHAEALQAIQKAVDICENLARDNFAAFGENLCLSLSAYFFVIEQDMKILERLWTVYQRIEHFTEFYFKPSGSFKPSYSFEQNLSSALITAKEKGSTELATKLTEIQQALANEAVEP